MAHEVKPTKVKEENVEEEEEEEIRESVVVERVMTYANVVLVDINICQKCHYMYEDKYTNIEEYIPDMLCLECGYERGEPYIPEV